MSARTARMLLTNITIHIWMSLIVWENSWACMTVQPTPAVGMQGMGFWPDRRAIFCCEVRNVDVFVVCLLLAICLSLLCPQLQMRFHNDISRHALTKGALAMKGALFNGPFWWEFLNTEKRNSPKQTEASFADKMSQQGAQRLVMACPSCKLLCKFSAP